MARDDEIKLKIATIIDEAAGEKKKSRWRILLVLYSAIWPVYMNLGSCGRSYIERIYYGIQT